MLRFYLRKHTRTRTHTQNCPALLDCRIRTGVSEACTCARALSQPALFSCLLLMGGVSSARFAASTASITSPTDSVFHPSHNQEERRRTGSDRMRATGSASSYPACARAHAHSLSHSAAHTRSSNLRRVEMADLRTVKKAGLV